MTVTLNGNRIASVHVSILVVCVVTVRCSDDDVVPIPGRFRYRHATVDEILAERIVARGVDIRVPQVIASR